MNGENNFFKADKAGLALAAAFLVTTLTGCVGYVDGPRASISLEAPVFAAQDDYVHYPQYECYYSVSRRQYAYREGNSWVARPAPRGVSVKVMQASPSVKMNFHDSPANHRAAVVNQYPKNWKPSGLDQGRKENQNNDAGIALKSPAGRISCRERTAAQTCRCESAEHTGGVRLSPTGQ